MNKRIEELNAAATQLIVDLYLIDEQVTSFAVMREAKEKELSMIQGAIRERGQVESETQQAPDKQASDKQVPDKSRSDKHNQEKQPGQKSRV